MQAMSNHPHSTGRLLPSFSSSVSSTSSDHPKLSRGSCTGLLFQLFDWNSRLQKKQLFRHKSLPAERPRSLTPKDLFCCKEKLPSAEMANASGEASTPCHQEAQSEDTFQKDQTPEKKRKKRSPNVVAKLMGLETMPSPDLRREKWPIHYQFSMPIQGSAESSFRSNSRVPSSRRSLMEFEKGAKSTCSSRWGFNAEPISRDSSHIRHNDSGVHDETRCQPRTHNGQARKVSTMVAAQSSTDAKNGAFGCVLSSSNMHNKIILPVQSASTSNTSVAEAAKKVLEHNMQPRHALNRLVESNACSNDNGKENIKATAQRQSSCSKEQCDSSRLYPDNFVPNCASKQDKKITDAANLPAASRLHATSRQSSSSATTDAVVRKLKQRQQIENDDKESAKCHSSQQGTESIMEKKGNPYLKRLENTCSRQFNEANSGELPSTTPAIVKLEMEPSSSKTSAHHHESHETSSTLSPLSTITQSKSVSHRNDLSKGRRLSSSGKAKVYKEKSDEGATSIKLPYSRGAGMVGSERSISQGRIKASKCKTMGNKSSVELRQDGPSSSKSCKSKGHIQESGSIKQDTSRCNDVSHVNVDFCPGVQDFDNVALSEIVHESDEPQVEGMRESSAFSTSAEITSKNFGTQNISSNISVTHNICPSTCFSSVDDMRDTASSCDINSTHRKKQAVSYSGKSTATILQELLSALNSSAKLPVLENERIQQESEVSGVTSTTIKTTEDTLNNSCSCIAEEDSYSLAVSPLASNVCLQSSAGDFDRFDHLGSKSKCWQWSPTSSLVSPLDNSPCSNSSESKEIMKDGHIYSKCMHSSTKEKKDAFTCSSQISSDKGVSRGTNIMIQSEEDYVDSIVRAAKSCNDLFSIKLKANDFIPDPANFNKLEKMLEFNWKWKAESKAEVEDFHRTNTESVHHDEDVAQDYRKLMFDCVQEALRVDVGIGEHSLVQLDDVLHLHLPPEVCCRRVLKRIHDWKSVRCGLNVDDMVENAMSTGAGKWVDFSCEHDEVAAEVGAHICNDLVDELVLDLVSCLRMVPDARSAKTARLGRMERKRLIWVGL